MSADVIAEPAGGINPNENTGRWTQEEHERFLQGLELYGKKWTKVAEVVQSRTTVQVRSHAQKYFQKMVKGKMDLDQAANTGAGARRAGAEARSRMNLDSMRRHIPIPPPLQPYMPPGNNDIATGLYHYLSPVEVPTGTTSSSTVENVRNAMPGWYSRGGSLDHMLHEAESLDWVADNGAAGTGDEPSEHMDQSEHGGQDLRRREELRSEFTASPPSGGGTAYADTSLAYSEGLVGRGSGYQSPHSHSGPMHAPAYSESPSSGTHPHQPYLPSSMPYDGSQTSAGVQAHRPSAFTADPPYSHHSQGHYAGQGISPFGRGTPPSAHGGGGGAGRGGSGAHGGGVAGMDNDCDEGFFEALINDDDLLHQDDDQVAVSTATVHAVSAHRSFQGLPSTNLGP